MFDPVTDEALRLRRRGAIAPSVQRPISRTSLVCSVCKREMGPEEQVFWVSGEAHCFQCHSMLEYEYGKEREADHATREKGTRWKREE